MSAQIIRFPKRDVGDNVDRLAEQITGLALNALARRQLGLPVEDSTHGSRLSAEAQRMGELLADRAERGGVPVETQRQVDRIKDRLANGPRVIRFPRSRVTRTKAQQRRLQQFYRDSCLADLSPAERFEHCQIALDVEAAMAKRASP